MEAFGTSAEVISAPILDRAGDVCGAVLIGVPAGPRVHDMQCAPVGLRSPVHALALLEPRLCKQRVKCAGRAAALWELIE